MPGWASWTIAGIVIWIVASVGFGAVMGRGFGVFSAFERRFGGAAEHGDDEAVAAHALAPEPPVPAPGRLRILLVDDDPNLRVLLSTTLAADECAVEEAGSAEEAREVARFWRPSLVVLDVGLPGMSGLAFCEELATRPVYGAPRVILLTGGDVSPEDAAAARADALLRKPFSPLDLIGTIDRLLDGGELPPAAPLDGTPDQLLAYARDLGELVQAERAQRRLLQHAYRQTVAALTDALEARSRGTGRHAHRVHRYALELTEVVAPGLLQDPSLEYGFLLHDIGKIGIPDAVLDKDGPLDVDEMRLMQQHPVIGAQLLIGVPLLDGEGLRVVRNHHERWDGTGYPDGLVGDEIPTGARIFAVADALDAMTSERPYRPALGWDEAVDEILGKSGSQFDPHVVGAFARRERRLRRTQHDLAGIA